MLTDQYSERISRTLMGTIVTFIVLMLWSLCDVQRQPSAQAQESSRTQPFEAGQNLITAGANQDAVAEPAKPDTVVIELFYRSDSEQSQNAQKYLQELQTAHSGIEVKTYDVLKDKQQLARLWQLSKQFGRRSAWRS